MLKAAIIGAGAISPAHINGYLQFAERVEIVAISDIYPDKAAKLAKEFNLINVDIYDQYEELLNRPEIDVVSVCTPPYTHAEITVKCMHAGKNVLVEKPMASSLEECDAMNRAQEETGKLLAVVSQNRFTSAMMKLKNVLDTKLMGTIVHTQVDSFWWRGHSYYDLWWRGTWEKEGGGCTLNHAVHHIDIFHWLNGMPKQITALASNVSHDNAEVEDLSIALCRYENGSLAQITSSVVHHGEEQQLIFQGKNARVSVPWKVSASRSKGNGFPEKDEELEQKLQAIYEQLPELEFEGHTAQIDNVLSAIEGKKELLVDGKEGRKTLELITAIYQSASAEQSVTLPLDANSPFYSREGVLENAIHFHEKKASIENFADNEITISGE